MPLGLWKSKWEIHREDMARFWTEMDRRHEEVQAKLRREQEESDRRWTELQEKSDALREETKREFAETRSFNREMLIRLERSERNVEAALKMMSDEIVGLRREVHDLTDAVSAQTEAILRLVDRFEEFGGRFAA